MMAVIIEDVKFQSYKRLRPEQGLRMGLILALLPRLRSYSLVRYTCTYGSQNGLKCSDYFDPHNRVQVAGMMVLGLGLPGWASHPVRLQCWLNIIYLLISMGNVSSCYLEPILYLLKTLNPVNSIYPESCKPENPIPYIIHPNRP